MYKKFLLISASCAAVGLATPAQAQEREFNIPALPADDAIPAFARQAGIQILAPGGLKGVTTQPVRGRYQVREALRLMIASTGLSVVADSGEAITLAVRRQPVALQRDVATATYQPAEQEQAPAPDIIVTGSRIKRAGTDTLQPADSVSANRVNELGLNTIAEAINQLPAFGTPTSGAGGQDAQTIGQNFVNAFGLGTSRTLTLFNGRRVVSQSSPGNASDPGQQVDLNILPSIMIDRVEAIYTGGAPTYGSDAIAGTVNVILKDRYDGLSLDAQTGISSRGDAANYRLAALAGTDFADGRGHIVISGEYNKIEGLSGKARKKIAAGYNYCNNPANTGANDGIPDQIICEDSDSFAFNPLTGGPMPTSGYFYRGTNDFLRNGESLVFSLDGRSLITASQANLGTPVSITNSAGANGSSNPYVVNQAETNSLIAPVERKAFAGNLEFELTDSLSLYAEGLYAHTRAVDEYSQGGFSTSLFSQYGGDIAVRLDNPFLTTAVRDEIAAANPPGIDTNRDGVADTPGFYLSRYNQDLLQGAPSYRTQEVYRFVGGFKGEFAVGGRAWNWDVSYNYGRTKATLNTPSINLTRFGLALDAVTDANGQVACRVSADPTAASGTGAKVATPITAADISGCVPFNPLGYATTPNLDAARAYIVQDVEQSTILEQQVVEATLAGQPFTLPAGNVGIAMGLTYRHESADYSGLQADLGYYLGGTLAGIHGAYHTKEAYAEAVIPILSRAEGFSLPLVNFLTFEGAARIVDNSFTGSEWTWTAGGKLGLELPLVGDTFTVRGNFTRAVRAPSFPELLTPPSATISTGADPCDPRNIDSGSSPANRAASCAAQVAALQQAGSLPAGFSLDSFTSQVVNVAAAGTNSGNPTLQNETSKSWTVGLLIQPSTIPGLRASIDWTDITIDDAIVSASLSQLFATCYDNGAFGSDPACGRFTRDPTNFQVTGFEIGYLNAAQRRFAGLLVDAQYSFGIDAFAMPTRITVGFNGFFIDRNEQTINGGDLDIFAGERGYEKYRGQGRLQIDLGRFNALWQADYVSGGDYDVQASEERRDPGDFGAMWTHNLSLAFMPADAYELRFTVRNLFDKTDSIARIAAKTTNAVIGGGNLLSNQIGRTFSFNAKVRF